MTHQTISSAPIEGRKPGTSGLRKKKPCVSTPCMPRSIICSTRSAASVPEQFSRPIVTRLSPSGAAAR